MRPLLTIDAMRGAYVYLAETEPFKRWNLPDAEDVKFSLIRGQWTRGTYQRIKKRHCIALSLGTIKRTISLIEAMAHEMIHLHEENVRACGRGEHSAAFNKWADLVCKVHGFDRGLF